MIECLELVCPAGHCLALFFYKTETMSTEEAALSFAGMAESGMFSDLCTKCGQRATTAAHRAQIADRIQEWSDLPNVDVPADSQAVVLVRQSNGGTRVGAVNLRIIPEDPAGRN